MRKPQFKGRHAELSAPLVFFIFTLMGVAYIVGAKLYELPAVVVTLAPVGLMLAYAAMILFLRNLRLRDDQTGDNFYYMGFIYTLTSLAVSLYQYSSRGAIDDIIRNFGIAVASTIAGIALRIFFNQMRRDPVEVEHHSRLDLAEASSRVRRELDGMLIELAHFRRTNQQMLTEGFQEIREQVEISTQGTMTSMEALAKNALEHVRDANSAVATEVKSHDIKQQLDEAAKSVKRVGSVLTKSSEQIGQAAELLATKLSDFSSPEKVLEIRLQPTIDGLQKAITDAIDRLDVQHRETETFRDAFISVAATLERSAAELARSAAAMEALQRTTARKGGLLARFRRTDPSESGNGTPEPVKAPWAKPVKNSLAEALDEKSGHADR